MTHQKSWIQEKLKTTSPSNFVSFDNSISIKPTTQSSNEEKFSTEPIYVTADDEVVMHRILISNTIVNGKSYEIRIQKSMIEDEDLLNSILFLQLLLLVVLLGGLILINFKISKKIWQPFNSIVDQLNTYRVDSNKDFEDVSTNINEFKNLSSSIKKLTERNTQLFKAQKEFTANASHELQTPVAVMQSKVELLMQTSPISEEQSELISQISVSANKMQRLNRTLLLLAKIENNQFPETSELNLNEIIIKLKEQYEEAFSQKQIKFETDLQNENTLTANAILMDILIGNLISNAIRHTEFGKSIVVKTLNSSFEISNEGKNKLDENVLFQRFKKQSENTNSIGLGLEICSKICELYHFKISYDFKDSKHFFTIYF